MKQPKIISDERGEKIHRKIQRWEKKQAAKKPIKAWAAIAPNPSAYEYLDGIISWSIDKRRRKTTNRFRDWKDNYRRGYRVRRITITVED